MSNKMLIIASSWQFIVLSLQKMTFFGVFQFLQFYHCILYLVIIDNAVICPLQRLLISEFISPHARLHSHWQCSPYGFAASATTVPPRWWLSGPHPQGKASKSFLTCALPIKLFLTLQGSKGFPSYLYFDNNLIVLFCYFFPSQI